MIGEDDLLAGTGDVHPVVNRTRTFVGIDPGVAEFVAAVVAVVEILDREEKTERGVAGVLQQQAGHGGTIGRQVEREFRRRQHQMRITDEPAGIGRDQNGGTGVDFVHCRRQIAPVAEGESVGGVAVFDADRAVGIIPAGRAGAGVMEFQILEDDIAVACGGGIVCRIVQDHLEGVVVVGPVARFMPFDDEAVKFHILVIPGVTAGGEVQVLNSRTKCDRF